jgi:RimJ/RimL family protein N-acetyltransferase
MPDDAPLGAEVDWTPVERPASRVLRGSHVLLRPIDPDADAGSLHAASNDPSIWTYLPYGPYERAGDLKTLLDWEAGSEDPLFYAVAPLPDEVPLGVASYLRITPEHGVIEIGHIWFGLPLQRTAAATEAIFLLARHAFDDLGYRRLEWKCNALNAASRRAAERFGFTFEGVFRNHMVLKGRNRDSAWYAITDTDWPGVRAGYEAWLSPGNFDGKGLQTRRLADLIAAQTYMP